MRSGYATLKDGPSESSSYDDSVFGEVIRVELETVGPEFVLVGVDEVKMASFVRVVGGGGVLGGVKSAHRR